MDTLRLKSVSSKTKIGYFLKIKRCTVPLKPLRTCTKYALENLMGKYGYYFQEKIENNPELFCPTIIQALKKFQKIFPDPQFRPIYPGKWSRRALLKKNVK